MALREEKKRATRLAIADAAMGLFGAHGFDRVTVAEVADAARVSINTVFNYFPTKEDLFFDRQAEVIDRLAGAVRQRAADESPAAAVHRLFLDELRRDEPTLGLSAEATTFWQLVDASPALQARLRLLGEQTEAALAEAITESIGAGKRDATPRVLAAALAGIDRALHAEIRHRLQSGDAPDAVRRDIRKAAGLFETMAGLGVQ
ncbi:TetR family transcriptional regulator [Nocardia colli]|uniref:TetR family transcriptional regulator n=1 Tax=Nocardia colli TaxID=2545717 RepID=A0A5N0EBZ1_9NOCA|nr:TetR family transcriptional regulator [Nocardia colli]KAA8886947.1 TetR family transcriptional regulator [Nocardia colli]